MCEETHHGIGRGLDRGRQGWLHGCNLLNHETNYK
jgi:hypothetical protein